MKTMELQPTRENLIATLSENLLDRNISLYRFVSLLDHIEGSQSISIDAPWGAGKTFFVKQTKLVLDAFNPRATFELEEDQKNKKSNEPFCESVRRKRDGTSAPSLCLL